MQSMTSPAFTERGRRRAVGLGIDPARLPPGQTPTVKWPVLSIEETPELAAQAWTLTVDGAVEEPFTLGWAELTAEPMTDWGGDVHCVTRWSKFGMSWRGVAVWPLLARARPMSDAGFLLAESVGGYTTNLPLSDVRDHPALIALAADGAPLEREHGGPVRLLVPHLYLWKSAKWLARLHVLAEDELGFWERNGYHHRGDPWQEERHSVDAYVAQARRRELRADARARERRRHARRRTLDS